ncbi:hypothetical protein RO21_07850 [[Actinobacillus] muris]|uniref:Uncharacterized protein n=1 Tax=Muribacter muris TaxID=67855 RepID=A0A0J5P484_9PAST|nr:hypothetical protein RO21_07850 [[Actinobacillus] muris] [Muribacter muris]
MLILCFLCKIRLNARVKQCKENSSKFNLFWQKSNQITLFPTPELNRFAQQRSEKATAFYHRRRQIIHRGFLIERQFWLDFPIQAVRCGKFFANAKIVCRSSLILF